MNQIIDIEKELELVKLLLEESKQKEDVLKKAIWDILNYARVFIVLIDSDMKVKLANWSLATKLGFNSETEIIGSDWLNFINEKNKEYCETLKTKKEAKNFFECLTNLVLSDGTILPVKWFNIPINGNFNVILSIGIYDGITVEQNEDSIRSYYRDIIETDKSMIKSMKETFLKNIENVHPSSTFFLDDNGV